jgi:hypothetical protein
MFYKKMTRQFRSIFTFTLKFSRYFNFSHIRMTTVKNKIKIKDFGKTQVALDVLAKFAGRNEAMTLEAEHEAQIAIQKSLGAYGRNLLSLRVNMENGEIVWQNGMANVLGRQDVHRFDQFQDSIHPTYLANYNFWLTCLLEEVAIQNFDFVDLTFHITVPLKNELTQEYSWYNQHSIALINDTEGNVVSNFSIYTFNSEWHENSGTVMIAYISYKNRLSEADKTLKFRAGQKILQYEFTEMERNIIDCYAENIKPKERYQTMSKNTIYEHNTHIIQKAKTIFNCDFTNAEKFAQFLKMHHLWQKAQNTLN